MIAVVTMCVAIGIYTMFRQFTLDNSKVAILVVFHDHKDIIIVIIHYVKLKGHQNRIGILHLLYIGTVFVALWPTYHWIVLHGGLGINLY